MRYVKSILLGGLLSASVAAAQDWVEIRVNNLATNSQHLTVQTSDYLGYRMQLVIPAGTSQVFFGQFGTGTTEFSGLYHDESGVTLVPFGGPYPLPDGVFQVVLWNDKEGYSYAQGATIGGNYIGYFIQGLCAGLIFGGIAAAIWIVRKGVTVSTGGTFGD